MNRTPQEAREIYLSELAQIERVIGFVCHRNGLSIDDAEEFRGEIHLHLIGDDYRVLRKFDGRSAVTTYLTVVTQRFLLDFRDQRWGKWRPSVAARRAGSAGVRLETLMVRDGHSFGEAVEMLRSDERFAASRDDLYAIAVTFPRRQGKGAARHVDLSKAEQVEDGSDPEQQVLESEQRLVEGEVEEVLRREMGALGGVEKLMLRMTYVDGHKISDVARITGVDAKQLYRRLERLKAMLRRALEARGVGAKQVQSFFEQPRRQQLDLAEILAPRPSQASEADDRVNGNGEFA